MSLIEEVQEFGRLLQIEPPGQPQGDPASLVDDLSFEWHIQRN